LTDKLKLDQASKDLFIKRERWPYTLSNLYKNTPEENKTEFFKKIQNALNEKYKIKIDQNVLSDGQELATTLAKHLVINSGIKDDRIMFVSPEGVIKIYDDPKSLSNAIGNEINITGFSDFAPRLTFKDPENDISKQSDEQISEPKTEIEIDPKFLTTTNQNTYIINGEWVEGPGKKYKDQFY
jgi:hypothetical protein